MRQVLFTLPGGLEIRGYGAMLVLAFLSSTWLAWRRARAEKLDPEVISDIAFWIFLFGMVGARLFYCIEYWGDDVKSVWQAFQFWRGGIVYYGGIIGGAVAFLLYHRVYRFPFRPFLDVVAPSIAVGTLFGRLGCFLNGCCYGDSCQLPWAVSFPRLSPPWSHHYALGLIGPNAPYSLPVHPTQLYSAIDAFILFLLLSAYFPLRKRDGEVMGLLVICYPITRFLIEILRNDEGVFILGLTISQTISVSLFATGLLYWAWLSRLPKTLYRDQAPAPEPHAPLVASAQP